MDFNQIRYFVALADTLNFTRAAEKANISQPTLTQSVKKLEVELGGPLIHRDGRKTRLTLLGLELLEDLIALSYVPARIRNRAQLILEGEPSKLRLSATPCVPSAFIAQAVSKALADDPELSINLDTRDRPQIESDLLTGEIDLAIVGQTALQHSLIDATEVGSDALVVIFPRDHGFKSKDKIETADLDEENIIARTHCPTEKILRSLMILNEWPTRAHIQVDSDEKCIEMVKSSLGIALISEASARASGLDYRRLSTTGVQFRYFLCLNAYGADTSRLRALAAVE